jgi:hypothetical protein
VRDLVDDPGPDVAWRKRKAASPWSATTGEDIDDGRTSDHRDLWVLSEHGGGALGRRAQVTGEARPSVAIRSAAAAACVLGSAPLDLPL